MYKVCGSCKKELPANLEFFATRKRNGKTEFQWQCRNCQKEYRRKHYLENKEKYIKKAKKYTKSIFDWFIEFKKTLKCEFCGENRYWVLDFHHIDKQEKDNNVAVIARQYGSKSKILKEIKKCKVLCSNCHRDLHYKEQAAIV